MRTNCHINHRIDSLLRHIYLITSFGQTKPVPDIYDIDDDISMMETIKYSDQYTPLIYIHNYHDHDQHHHNLLPMAQTGS